MTIVIPVFLFLAIVAILAAAKTLRLPRWKVALGLIGLCAIGAGCALSGRDLTKH
jgi:hypothetical protein